MKFRYTAFDRAGNPDTGAIEADTPAEAHNAIRAKGLFPSEVTPLGAARRDRAASVKVSRRLEHTADFTRQLHLLLAAGTPLVGALRAVARQTSDDAWRTIINDIIEDIETGRPLSESLRDMPNVFDHVFVGMVDAGEASGDLTGALDRLSVITRQHLALNKALVSAVTYPLLLIGVALVTLVGLIVKVVPSFEGLFESIGRPMPPTTVAMLAISHFLTSYWWLVLAIIAAAACGIYAYLKTDQGVRRLHASVIFTPPFAPVVRSLIVARIARVLGSAMESKVPLLEALAIAERATANVFYRELLADVAQRVSKGQSVAEAVRTSNLVTPSLAEAMANGEESGRLAHVLLGVANMMDEDNATRVKTLTGMLEPVILTVLGLVVGGIAMSLFLPLFDLTASAGGGP